jgi:hypothetical protein
MKELYTFIFTFVYYVLGFTLLFYVYHSIEEHFVDLSSNPTAVQERKLVTQQKDLAATAASAACFACSDFYSTALGQKDASSLIQYLQLQTQYVRQILDAIGQFVSQPVNKEACGATVATYIACLKKAVDGVKCPQPVGDLGCKLNLVNNMISKATLCVAQGTCKSVDEFHNIMKKIHQETATSFVKCAAEFTNPQSPCLALYINAIQQRILSSGGNDTSLLVTNGMMREELNRNASWAIQQSM